MKRFKVISKYCVKCLNCGDIITKSAKQFHTIEYCEDKRDYKIKNGILNNKIKETQKEINYNIKHSGLNFYGE